jgi:Tfp pilus assembly major pilin PilA
MQTKTKFKVIIFLLAIGIIISAIIFIKYFFTYEKRQEIKRSFDSFTGQNLTVTVFGYDGKIIKRWTGIQKITSGKTNDGSGERNYVYFYTSKGKYVQIPDSVWYIAEEE